MTPAEEWRAVPGHEGIYEVSDLGRVRRVRASQGARAGHILAGTQHGRGYLSVCLYKNRKMVRRTVHGLVARAFLGERLAGYQVNHKDGDKTNNALANLEYVTAADNYWHAVEAGLVSGVKPRARRLTRQDVTAIRRRAETERASEIAESYGLDSSYVSRIIRHQVWKGTPE